MAPKSCRRTPAETRAGGIYVPQQRRKSDGSSNQAVVTRLQELATGSGTGVHDRLDDPEVQLIGDPEWKAAVDAWWTKWLTRGEHWAGRDQARFRLAPKSSIVEVPNGNHYLFLANQAIVLAELRSFLRALPR